MKGVLFYGTPFSFKLKLIFYSMNSQPLDLLKKLLPGLLPLLIFILADEIWGTRVGLVVAIITGIGELLFVLVREKRIDRFIIFDTGLLLALGAVSLFFDNDIFFKLKPAFINLIMCAVLGLSAFSKKNLMLLYTRRYLKDLSMGPEQESAMQKMVRTMFWLMSAYTLLIIYSAFFMSKEAWAFISGGLLYIIFALYFGWQFIANRRNARLLQDHWFTEAPECFTRLYISMYLTAKGRFTSRKGPGTKTFYPANGIRQSGGIWAWAKRLNRL